MSRPESEIESHLVSAVTQCGGDHAAGHYRDARDADTVTRDSA